MPTEDELRELVAKWKSFESVSSNPGECDDDAFALGTEWGCRMAATQLEALLKR